jgi:hypothetical protein
LNNNRIFWPKIERADGRVVCQKPTLVAEAHHTANGEVSLDSAFNLGNCVLWSKLEREAFPFEHGKGDHHHAAVSLFIGIIHVHATSPQMKQRNDNDTSLLPPMP